VAALRIHLDAEEIAQLESIGKPVGSRYAEIGLKQISRD
jgi:hypothetical protein